MTAPFGKPLNLFESDVNEAFKKQPPAAGEDILRLVSLILSKNTLNGDLLATYKLLGLEKFTQLIHLYNGRAVRFPSSVEMKETIILAFCYYYREIKQLTWEEVQAQLPFDISAISYSSKIKSLSSFIKTQIRKIFEEGEES